MKSQNDESKRVVDEMIPGRICRQGDIYFTLVKKDNVPEDVSKVEVERGMLIVEEGEATGHYHAITPKPGIEMFAFEDEKYIEAPDGFNLRHDEHAEFQFPQAPKGYVYKAWRQKSYTPEKWRNVAD
jgi:hypothetical protein